MVATVRIGSLTDVLQSTRAEKRPAEVQQQTTAEEEVDWQTVQESTVKTIFKAFGDKLKAQRKMGMATYFIDPIYTLNGNTIKLTVGSKSLKTEIEASMSYLLKLFRAQKQQPLFEIEINVEKVKEYKVFTPKQQFEALAKKHPVLKDFEERFGLDFDV